jgi:uncharacterized protein YprB with RNaseH-like and TPR domain
MKLDKSTIIKKVRMGKDKQNISLDTEQTQKELINNHALKRMINQCNMRINEDIKNGKLHPGVILEHDNILRQIILEYENKPLSEGVKNWGLGECYHQNNLAIIEKKIPLKIKLDKEDGIQKLLSNPLVLKKVREQPQLQEWIEEGNPHLVYPVLRSLKGRKGCATLSEPIHIQPAKMHGYNNIKIIDIETTGLEHDPSHILHGIATIHDDYILIRQYLLLDLLDQYTLIHHTIPELQNEMGYVCYNKGYDLTKITKRRANLGLLHYNPTCVYDMMHFSRRFFELKKPLKLQYIEKHYLNIEREDAFEVPGSFIYKYYLSYLENSSIGPLLPIIYHNQKDLITTARIFKKIIETW